MSKWLRNREISNVNCVWVIEGAHCLIFPLFCFQFSSLITVQMPTDWVQENHFTSRVPVKMCCRLSRSARFLGMQMLVITLSLNCLFMIIIITAFFLMFDCWHFRLLLPYFDNSVLLGCSLLSQYGQCNLFVEKWKLCS